jgi:hypothetical protein
MNSADPTMNPANSTMNPANPTINSCNTPLKVHDHGHVASFALRKVGSADGTPSRYRIGPVNGGNTFDSVGEALQALRYAAFSSLAATALATKRPCVGGSAGIPAQCTCVLATYLPRPVPTSPWQPSTGCMKGYELAH